MERVKSARSKCIRNAQQSDLFIPIYDDSEENDWMV